MYSADGGNRYRVGVTKADESTHAFLRRAHEAFEQNKLQKHSRNDIQGGKIPKSRASRAGEEERKANVRREGRREGGGWCVCCYGEAGNLARCLVRALN
jgi:hypothetical protein